MIRKFKPYTGQGEGLPVVRLIMVISSLSPLLILWSITGFGSINDVIFIPIAASVVAISHLIIWFRFRRSIRLNDKHPFTVDQVEDNRQFVLVYLLATLLPFYRGEIDGIRDVVATLVALAIIVFIFMRLNLHYVNIGFVILGYRIFTVNPTGKFRGTSATQKIILITKRRGFPPQTNVTAYRISDDLYWERPS